jgi:hypothetical protein
MRTSDTLVSQSELLLPRDSSSGVHTATTSVRATTPSANSASGYLDPSGSPLTVLIALRPPRSQPAADARKTSIAQACPLWPEFRRHSSGASCLRVTANFRAHSTLLVTAHCFSARLYALLTAISIYYRNLRGCLFEYRVRLTLVTPTKNGDCGQLTTSEDIQSGHAASAI